MSATRSEDGTDERRPPSWATESLPLAVRKELLERELDRMGLRKVRAQPAATSHDERPAGAATHGD